MPSFLRNLTPSMVVREPFPHVYVERLLDEKLCSRLAAEIPPPDKYTKGRAYYDDEKLYRNGRELLADPDMSETWKRIIADHVRPDTFRDFYRLFEAEIAREFPELAERLAKLDSSRIGHRSQGNDYDVLLEAQHVYFMPVRGVSGAERGPHVKTPEKIFGSFLCLRTDDDDSTGGDFVLHGARPGATPRFGTRNQIDPKDLIPVRTYPRKRNVFVGFLNTPRSVTQMTPRSSSAKPSVYLNILVGLSPRMWQPNRLKRMISGWQRW